MVFVKKQKGESDQRLIDRFRQQVIDSGVLLDLREKERYEKKSERRKKQKYYQKHRIEVEKKREAA